MFVVSHLAGCWKWAVLSGLYNISPPHPALFGFVYRQASISMVINEVGRTNDVLYFSSSYNSE